MFFSAAHCIAPPCTGLQNLAWSIGRARSPDGMRPFVPEPAPVISGAAGGEAYLTAPVVLRDGSVFKMWYAFTRTLPLGDPCIGSLQVGYATSSDGFFWVRSPSNPVFSVGNVAWAAGTPGLLPTAVVPLDGHDPESGLALYYSPLHNYLVACTPLDIGRAVAH
jgi:hypothetical protein